MFTIGWLWFYIKHAVRLMRQGFRNGYQAAKVRNGSELMPVKTLSIDALEVLSKVFAYIDSMPLKSESLIRHDALALRNALMGK